MWEACPPNGLDEFSKSGGTCKSFLEGFFRKTFDVVEEVLRGILVVIPHPRSEVAALCQPPIWYMA